MSVGNYGAIKNQLEAQVGLDFGPLTSTLGARSNQGVAILPSLIHQVLARPDFVNTLNAKIYSPTLNAASTQTISSAATSGVVAVFWDNSQAAIDAYIEVFGIATGVPGTTQQAITVYAPFGKQGVALFAQPIIPVTNTGLSWDSTTNVTPGATRSVVSTVTVSLIYLQ